MIPAVIESGADIDVGKTILLVCTMVAPLTGNHSPRPVLLAEPMPISIASAVG
jgi:hypothetical protein